MRCALPPRCTVRSAARARPFSISLTCWRCPRWFWNMAATRIRPLPVCCMTPSRMPAVHPQGSLCATGLATGWPTWFWPVRIRPTRRRHPGRRASGPILPLSRRNPPMRCWSPVPTSCTMPRRSWRMSAATGCPSSSGSMPVGTTRSVITKAWPAHCCRPCRVLRRPGCRGIVAQLRSAA